VLNLVDTPLSLLSEEQMRPDRATFDALLSELM
jgi:hypothetical protein